MHSIKKISISFFASLASFAGISQSYYHLQYRSPLAGDTNTYNAFFAVYDNGTAFARINSSEPGTGIIETESIQQFPARNDGTIDTTLLLFENKDPKSISGSMPSGFTAPVYWFGVNASDNSAQPLFLTGKPNDTSGKREFMRAEIISSSQLADSNFILTYFTPGEAFYQNRFGINSKGVGLLTNDEKKQRLFLLVVASTHDKTIAQGTLMDARRIMEDFGNITAFLGIRPVFDSVYGDNYGWKNVENALKKIEAKESKKNGSFNPNDIIVFWFSGHGFSDVHSKDPVKRNKQYAYMDLLNPLQAPRPEPRDSTMNIEDVYNRIKKIGCRFNLVIANCCDDEILPKPKPENNIPPMPKPKGVRGPKWNWNNVYSLIMKQHQSLLLNSASQGQPSFTSNSSGSVYVNFFLHSLLTSFLPDKASPNWMQIIQDAKTQTINKIINSKIGCPEPFQPNKMCDQTPSCVDCDKLKSQ